VVQHGHVANLNCKKETLYLLLTANMWSPIKCTFGSLKCSNKKQKITNL
jgi:hypothetical protein